MSYQTIHYWPNNWWCYKGEPPLPQYMSDDYVTMDVPDNMTYEQIDALVETMNYFLENEKWTKTKSRS
jgi:hypothetical protein